MPNELVTSFPSFTFVGQGSSIISGTLSSLSSTFVMTFILRSESKLSRAYHRIIFFMSFWDLVSSLAIAMTTLPMPADVHSVYDFAGKAFGTHSTCQAQAFLIVLGSFLTIFSNGVLNLYYVCTIRFGVREEKFNNVALPIFLVIAVAVAVTCTIYLLEEDLLNPVPFYPHCLVAPYPFHCNTEEDADCIRGEATLKKGNLFEIMFLAFVGSILIIISVSLILVISTVFKTEMEARDAAQARALARDVNENDDQDQDQHRDQGQDQDQEGSTTSPPPRREFKETRAALRQALMYIAAFLLTWGWMVIITLAGNETTEGFTFWRMCEQLKLIFQPLQGFFNALIFVYSKVWIQQRANARLSVREALRRVIVCPKSVPDMFISRLDIVITENRHWDDEEEPRRRSPQLIRTGGNLLARHRTDEPPRITPNSVVSSMETPSVGMNLSQMEYSSNTLRNEREEVIDNNPSNTSNVRQDERPNKDDRKKLKSRKFYQWPPPDWVSLSARSSNGSECGRSSEGVGQSNMNMSDQIENRDSTGGLMSYRMSCSDNNTSAQQEEESNNNDDDGNVLSSRSMEQQSNQSCNYSTGGIMSIGSSSHKNLSLSENEWEGDESLIRNGLAVSNSVQS